MAASKTICFFLLDIQYNKRKICKKKLIKLKLNKVKIKGKRIKIKPNIKFILKLRKTNKNMESKVG